MSVDPSWNDEPGPATADHRIVSDEDQTVGPAAPPFEDVERIALPSAGDLADCRLLVVAGQGAGQPPGSGADR